MLRFGTIADKELVESICNNPEVLRWTASDNSKPFVADRFLQAPNMTLIGDGGCFIGLSHGDGRYEGHTNFLVRGREAMRAGVEAANIMFTQTDCVELQTMVPGNNRHAKLFAKMLGFRYLFYRPDYWQVGGKRYPMEFFSLSVDDWIMQGHCVQQGELFHERLTEIGGHTDHGHELAHDYYVGACIKMILNGQARKAEKIYSRWANLARFLPFKVLNDSPVIVDIGPCILIYENGQLTIEEKDHANRRS